MAATGQCGPGTLPMAASSGIVKPGMCSTGQCALHHTDTSAWWSNLPAICLHFLSLSISIVPTTVATKTRLVILWVSAVNNKCHFGHHCQRWRSDLWKNMSSSRSKLILRLFIDSFKHRHSALRQPPPLPKSRVPGWIRRINGYHTVERAKSSPWWWCLWDSCVWRWRWFCTYSNSCFSRNHSG